MHEHRPGLVCCPGRYSWELPSHRGKFLRFERQIPYKRQIGDRPATKLHAEGETGVAVLYLHNQGNDAFPVTYVYWNAADVDTITAQLSQNRNVITKAWINGIEAITGSTNLVLLVK